ncbi:MAG: PrsW family glutamic-type intramembrane protease [Anaerolineales bacterium]
MKNNNQVLPPEPVIPLPETPQDQALVPAKMDWLNLGQFIFSTAGAVLLLGAFLVSTLVMLLRDNLAFPGGAGPLDLSPYLFAAGVGFSGVLMVPSAYYSGQKLFSKKPRTIFQWDRLRWLSFLFPIPILLGFAIQNGPTWSRALFPIVHVLANGFGVLWLLDSARRHLPQESARRVWGSLVSGLGLTPLITFTLEILLLIAIGVFWLIMLQSQPDFRQDLLNLASRLQQSPTDPQLLERSLGRFAARPGVIATLFLYIAVLIPIIEELFKPIAVWLLLGRKLQPWEGFSIGATAGAGYALFENLSVGSAVEIWTLVTVTRLGTTAVHIFATGLVGWGLASAFTEKKYGRLAGTFLAAVLLHGVWNGLNILSTLGELSPVRDLLGNFGSSLAAFAPAGLVLLAVGCFVGLFKANSSVRRAIMAQEN